MLIIGNYCICSKQKIFLIYFYVLSCYALVIYSENTILECSILRFISYQIWVGFCSFVKLCVKCLLCSLWLFIMFLTWTNQMVRWAFECSKFCLSAPDCVRAVLSLIWIKVASTQCAFHWSCLLESSTWTENTKVLSLMMQWLEP